jgi:hypothetical protein
MVVAAFFVVPLEPVGWEPPEGAGPFDGALPDDDPLAAAPDVGELEVCEFAGCPPDGGWQETSFTCTALSGFDDEGSAPECWSLRHASVSPPDATVPVAVAVPFGVVTGPMLAIGGSALAIDGDEARR